MVSRLKRLLSEHGLHTFACFTTALSAFILISPWGCASHAFEDAPIGVIQYNVKGGQGGRSTADGVLDKPVSLIVNQINAASVDFLTLEQASESPGLPGTIISTSLAKNGLTDWHTIVSACNKDVPQLAFSSAWELVNDPK